MKRPSGETIVYTYDARGNRKTLKDDSRIEDTKEQTYTFNVWDQLSKVVKDNVTTEFEYEMQGLRLSKTKTTAQPVDENGQTPPPVVEKIRYAYNNSGKVISEANANNQSVANYVWGPDRLLAKREVSTNKKYYYLYNGHGDVVQLVDESGETVNRYQYDEWGNILQQEEGTKNAFKYAGEILDEETGLYYLRARYYDPSLGRFVSKDTYEGSVTNPLSLNLYTYVISNPLIYTDPTGHYHKADGGGSGGGRVTVPKWLTWSGGNKKVAPAPKVTLKPSVVKAVNHTVSNKAFQKEIQSEKAFIRAKTKPQGTGNAGRYSGALEKKVNKPDAAADALADKIGGQSRVRFSGDSAGREFDAISEQYVAQSKPALQTVNKSVRDQMKATFEAAQETGRKVYYHFEGEPAQSVIDKLNEYSNRYGIDVVIDTNPLK